MLVRPATPIAKSTPPSAPGADALDDPLARTYAGMLSDPLTVARGTLPPPAGPPLLQCKLEGPGSADVWGTGVAAAVAVEANERLRKAVHLLPRTPGSMTTCSRPRARP